MTKPCGSAWQQQVLRDLGVVVDAFPGDVRVVGGHQFVGKGALMLQLKLRLRTAEIPRITGGLPLECHEDVTVWVGPTDLAPPLVEVGHDRFVGYPHVLQGRRLCLYLDVAREWDPLNGFGGFLDRLFGWFADAASARFDAQNALYHAVGGVIHAADGAPTVVVRQTLQPCRRAQHGWLIRRTPHRWDLDLERPADAAGTDHAPLILLDTDLPLGGGDSLADLLIQIGTRMSAPLHPDNPYMPVPAERSSATLLSVLGASAIRKPDGSSQRFVLAVPHPTGGPPHLLAACIPAAGADHLRALVRANRDRSPTIDIEPAQLDPATPLHWWPVSDERPEISNRRDAARPVASYGGKTIAVWGCGGLGSWIAEYVVRAGAKKVLLCDPGAITGGLLVRQNFVESDVGDSKVAALARRLHAVSDAVEVAVYDALSPSIEDLLETDVVIDATVSIAVSRLLEQIAQIRGEKPVLAQAATDSRTSTLGMLAVSAPPLRAGPLTIDRAVGETIYRDAALEPFQQLWDSSAPGSQVIPTRGCSTPTFHGSAADLAAVAGCITSLLSAHLRPACALSGTHLISLPHGEAGPLREFIPAAPVENPCSGD
jgi:hypothetical protein